jgi:hypothetical protein
MEPLRRYMYRWEGTIRTPIAELGYGDLGCSFFGGGETSDETLISIAG